MTSIEKVDALKRHAKAINELYEEADCAAEKAKQIGSDAVKAALLCGQALIAAKVLLKHGEWLPWLASHCPQITRMTATKWMRLANVNHGLHLESASGLRQAYIAAGILPEEEPGAPSKPLPFPSRIESSFGRVESWVPKLMTVEDCRLILARTADVSRVVHDRLKELEAVEV